jgi:hypothetical protein
MMPVTEPNDRPFLVRNLELVEEDSEFSLQWQAATMNCRVRRETIVIGHDRPEVLSSSELTHKWRGPGQISTPSR